MRHGARFAVGGKTYRIVSVGSTNRHSPNGLHNEDTVIVESVKADPWEFPSMPAQVPDVAQALRTLFALPKFRVPELKGAIHA